MAPGNPKRPPRSPGVVAPLPAKGPSEGDRELGFDEADVLRADDPRPQHVPQLPVRRAQGRGAQRPQSLAFTSEQHRDRELSPAFDKTLTEPARAPAFLYVERGPGQGQLVPLVEGVLVIGRSSTTDFRLQHPSISRRHAQVLRREDRFFLKDFQSQNGTFVNKVRVSREVEIFPGDQIALGTALMKLRGPNQNGDPLGTTAELDAGGPSVVLKSRMFTIVALAGAGSFGLALCLAFGVLRMSDSGEDKTASASAHVVPAAPSTKASLASAAPTKATPVAPAASSEPAESVAAKGSRKRLSAAPTSLVAAAKPTPDVGHKPEGRTTQVASAGSHDKAAELPPELQPIRSKYEGGNVQGALELARKARATDLVSKLTHFRSAYDAAERAVATQDASALKHVQEALKLDEQIADGWGTYNAELKSQLTALKVHAASSRGADARARPAADDAWDDGATATAPAPKSPAPAKSKKTAIDAAWGD